MKCTVCNKDFEGNFCPFCGAKADTANPVTSAEKDDDIMPSDVKEYSFVGGWEGRYFFQITMEKNNDGKTSARIKRTGQKHYAVSIDGDNMKVSCQKNTKKGKMQETKVSEITSIKYGLFYSALATSGIVLCGLFAVLVPDKAFLLAFLAVVFLIFCKNTRVRLVTPDDKVIINSESKNKVTAFIEDLKKNPYFKGKVIHQIPFIKIGLIAISVALLLLAVLNI